MVNKMSKLVFLSLLCTFSLFFSSGRIGPSSRVNLDSRFPQPKTGSDLLVPGDLISLGGSGDDTGHCMLIDVDGYDYIAGNTSSLGLSETMDVWDNTYNGGDSDIFVSKIARDGSGIVKTTYIGGQGKDCISDLCLNTSGSGSLFISGYTNSPDFPIINGTINGSTLGGIDSFIVSIDFDLSQIYYSILIGGKGNDISTAIECQNDDNLFLTGYTDDDSFPVLNSSCFLNGTVNQSMVYNESIYFIDEFGLSIINYSMRPYVVANYSIEGEIEGLYVENSTAYITNNSGIIYLDVSDQMNLQVYGYNQSIVNCQQLAFGNLSAFFTNQTGIYSVNITLPSNTSIMDEVVTNSEYNCIFWYDGFLFAGNETGIAVYDVRNPFDITLSDLSFEPGSVNSIYLMNNTQYPEKNILLLGNASGLHTYDISEGILSFVESNNCGNILLISGFEDEVIFSSQTELFYTELETSTLFSKYTPGISALGYTPSTKTFSTFSPSNYRQLFLRENKISEYQVVDGFFQGGTWDGFVMNIETRDNNLVYSTFIGSNGEDKCLGIERYGNSVYIVGFQAPNHAEGIVYRIFDDGSLGFYNHIGGSIDDKISAIEIRENDQGIANLFCVGTTSSADFPTTDGVYSRNFYGVSDIFVLKLNPIYLTIQKSSLLGGTGQDEGIEISIDKYGAPFILGLSRSMDFPRKGRDILPRNDSWEITISKFNSDLSNLAFSSFFGSSGNDFSYDVYVDDSYWVYITAHSDALAFPGIEEDLAGGFDTIFGKFEPEPSYPTIEKPDKVEYFHSTTGNLIWWKVVDPIVKQGTYKIVYQEEIVKTGTWSSGDTITLQIDGLDAGNYTIKGIFEDGYGAIVESPILVEIIGLRASGDEYLEYYHSENGNYLSWTCNDTVISSPLFFVTIDGELKYSGNWINGTINTVSIDGLNKGIHDVRIQVSDGLGESIEMICQVKVKTRPFYLYYQFWMVLGIFGSIALIITWVSAAVVSKKRKLRALEERDNDLKNRIKEIEKMAPITQIKTGIASEKTNSARNLVLSLDLIGIYFILISYHASKSNWLNGDSIFVLLTFMYLFLGTMLLCPSLLNYNSPRNIKQRKNAIRNGVAFSSINLYFIYFWIYPNMNWISFIVVTFAGFGIGVSFTALVKFLQKPNFSSRPQISGKKPSHIHFPPSGGLGELSFHLLSLLEKSAKDKYLLAKQLGLGPHLVKKICDQMYDSKEILFFYKGLRKQYISRFRRDKLANQITKLLDLKGNLSSQRIFQILNDEDLVDMDEIYFVLKYLVERQSVLYGIIQSDDDKRSIIYNLARKDGSFNNDSTEVTESPSLDTLVFELLYLLDFSFIEELSRLLHIPKTTVQTTLTRLEDHSRILRKTVTFEVDKIRDYWFPPHSLEKINRFNHVIGALSKVEIKKQTQSNEISKIEKTKLAKLIKLARKRLFFYIYRSRDDIDQIFQFLRDLESEHIKLDRKSIKRLVNFLNIAKIRLFNMVSIEEVDMYQSRDIMNIIKKTEKLMFDRMV